MLAKGIGKKNFLNIFFLILFEISFLLMYTYFFG